MSAYLYTYKSVAKNNAGLQEFVNKLNARNLSTEINSEVVSVTQIGNELGIITKEHRKTEHERVDWDALKEMIQPAPELPEDTTA